MMSFKVVPRGQTLRLSKVDYIKQGDEVADGFVNFIQNKSGGFTRAGVERINESIRAYVWAVLGAQGQTRTSIVGIGPAFDAQKQFLSNVEDMISHAEDLPKSIKNYQDVLHFARSKVDFVLGEGLYMVPSNMELKVGQIENYNNEIIVATGQMSLGSNEDVNKQLPINVNKQLPNEVNKPVLPVKIEVKRSLPTVSSNNHEQNKNLLVVGAVSLGLGYYYLF
jgi:hypothetical protein